MLDPDFDVVSLCNLLSLYGYELTDCDGVTIGVTRIRDNSKFRSGAHTAKQWITQVKQWEAQPHPSAAFLASLWAKEIAKAVDVSILESAIINKAGQAGLANANGTRVSVQAVKPFVLTPGDTPIETNAQKREEI